MDNALVATIGAVFGFLTSVGFKLIPPLDRWYQNVLNPDYKGLFMLGISLLAPLGMLLVSCLGLFNLIPCQIDSWKPLLVAWVGFVGANLATFMYTPDSKEKKLNKLGIDNSKG